MKRVLVTGGLGFIGQHAVSAMLERGWEVVNLDLVPSGFVQTPSYREILGDVRDEDAVISAVEGVDAVVHLAALVSLQASIDAPDETYSINVEGTRCVLEACKSKGVSTFLHASSAAVYGNETEGTIDEGAPVVPLSPYGENKKLSEDLVTEAHRKGMRAASFRFFNVYGPGQRTQGAYAAVIPTFIQRMSRHQSPNVHGNGLATRGFIHVKDVVNAMIVGVEMATDSLNHRVYNIASGTSTTLLDIVSSINSTLIEHEHIAENIAPTHTPERQGDVRHSLGSAERLRNEFNWKPNHDFASSIRTLVNLQLEKEA
jgi:nucleoside-diphosphate-sugar epimerase